MQKMKKMNKYKILAVMGQAGSGKDYFVHTLIQNNYIPNAQEIVSCTTRPIRENEQDGVNYHFLTEEEFTQQVLDGEMLEATVFNNWYYGTSIKNLNPNCLNVGVFNPEGVEDLQANSNVDIQVVYITSTDKTRLLRQLLREERPNCDEIIRRYSADKADFAASRIREINPDFVIANYEDTIMQEIVERFALQFLGQDKLKD